MHVLVKLGEAGTGPVAPPVLWWFPCGLSPEQNQDGQDGRFPLPLVSLCQCWSRKNRHLLCAEHCPGKGEGRRDSRRLSDSEEFKTTEAAYGADTGKRN